MIKEEEAGGIVLKIDPQSEHTKRAVLLTDRFGKITAFASGAAKSSSGLIGTLRPFCCGHFTLTRGRSAFNLRRIELIDSFSDITDDYDVYIYASYILEFAAYFVQEGMERNEAACILNLMYVTLDALRKKQLPAELIRRMYEHRMLVIEGEYLLSPVYCDSPVTMQFYRFVMYAPLSKLFCCTDKLQGGSSLFEQEYIRNIDYMVSRQVGHSFHSLRLLGV